LNDQFPAPSDPPDRDPQRRMLETVFVAQVPGIDYHLFVDLEFDVPAEPI
jgi:hypothetical protein